MQKKKVVIIQNIIPHYRKEFFEKLKEKLDREGVEFRLIYGVGSDNGKGEVDFSWGTVIQPINIKIGKLVLFWRPCLSHLKNADLVICEQSNKNLITYYLMIARLFSKMKFAFWGHGRNRQSDKNSFSNKFKRFFIKNVDWWFAYTNQVKEELANLGYPENQITDVQNAIDTSNLIEEYNNFENKESSIKVELRIDSDNIAIYCGRIYSNKRIDFLLQAADHIKQQIPDFHLLIIGTGEQLTMLKQNIINKPWIHYLGPKFGLDRVKYFRISKVLLMPGLVGLAIVDSFALQTPIITTNYPYHSPEISYLANGINGVITENNLESYSNAVVELLTNREKLEKLQSGCKLSKEKYTIKNMVSNYFQGISNCINLN